MAISSGAMYGAANTPQGAAGKHGGKGLPPGIAKKQAADLPDGNPWKQVLAQMEQQNAPQGGGAPMEGPPQDPAAMQQQLAELAAMLQQMMQGQNASTPSQPQLSLQG
jgi:hypothetical protein